MESVAIIGGGIIGTSIAYRLRDAECDVHLYEKDMIGAGTTAKSAAMLTHHQEDPDSEAYELREHAWEWYDDRIAAGTFEFDQIGTLHLARSEDEFATIQEMQRTFASFGLDLPILSPDEIADHNIASDDLRGGLWFPDDGVLDPGAIVRFFADHARDGGVDIETGVAVTDVATSDDQVTGVETTAGFQSADVVINAAGPWAQQVNDLVGVDVPIRHTQGPILVLQADDPVSLPFTFFEEGIYIREEGVSQAFAGQLATDYEDSPMLDPNLTQAIDESMYLQVAEIADTYLPDLPAFDVINEWNGIRTVTPDGQPIVDETDVEGYLLACGMSGYGVTVAPAIGEFVADWLTTGRKPDSLAPLALGRFEAVA
ncbi:FAD-dependent oxidoreductase [Haloarculaceae archaeon H-GB2-1]|nr:FAD-dependent oxidoreductase [Haloarculaceae archaeon H-GB1-1]MEA5388021.1 FAD-dependent oxidoreductase [Haloarculaceae archaeon H-GB11]MEA5409509.1 FAD-dependent oxidoreductase [Haloarculaceae archaeon H-GB2-1]